MNGSGLSSAHMQTPPPDDYFPDSLQSCISTNSHQFGIEAWMELWDYAGGASFRAFMTSDGQEKSLFVFFDIEGILGRDLKKA